MRDPGGWAFLLFVAVAVVFIAWMRDAAWLAKLRYGGDHHAPITVAHRPHDCDFWGAPIGVKDCHYRPIGDAFSFGRGS
jgi:hypothetical protein